jgi:hypothetical protein
VGTASTSPTGELGAVHHAKRNVRGQCGLEMVLGRRMRRLSERKNSVPERRAEVQRINCHPSPVVAMLNKCSEVEATNTCVRVTKQAAKAGGIYGGKAAKG